SPRRKDRLAQIANRARENVGVTGAGAQDEGAFDANHQILRTMSRDGARQTGFDAERLDSVDPRGEGTAQRASKPFHVDARGETLEQARLLAAVVKAVERVQHAIELRPRRFVRSQRLEQRALELFLEVAQHLKRDFLFPVRKVVVQARLPKTRGF